MKELKSQSQKVSIFTSKSNILKFLQSRLKYSKIERILDFTVDAIQSKSETIHFLFRCSKCLESGIGKKL